LKFCTLSKRDYFIEAFFNTGSGKCSGGKAFKKLHPSLNLSWHSPLVSVRHALRLVGARKSWRTANGYGGRMVALIVQLDALAGYDCMLNVEERLKAATVRLTRSRSRASRVAWMNLDL
jgi:hypothetical protein